MLTTLFKFTTIALAFALIQPSTNAQWGTVSPISGGSDAASQGNQFPSFGAAPDTSVFPTVAPITTPTAETTFAVPAAATLTPVAPSYQKYPRQVLPVQFAQPTYSTLPSRFVPAQIPRIKPTTHTKKAPPIQQPAQFARNDPIQAPPLYGKAH